MVNGKSCGVRASVRVVCVCVVSVCVCVCCVAVCDSPSCIILACAHTRREVESLSDSLEKYGTRCSTKLNPVASAWGCLYYSTRGTQ